MQGSTTVAAEVRGPGQVSVADATLGGRSLTSIGRPPGAVQSADLRPACQRARAGGSAGDVLDDVRAVVWRKLAMAAASVRCARSSTARWPTCSSGARARHPAADFAEIVRVAAAEGVALDVEELWSDALETYRAIGPHPPSLAVDVARGRPSEIEAQLGEVVRRGESAGIPTPAADVLATVIRAKAPVEP